jgi:hypothetical protein
MGRRGKAAAARYDERLKCRSAIDAGVPQVPAPEGLPHSNARGKAATAQRARRLTAPHAGSSGWIARRARRSGPQAGRTKPISGSPSERRAARFGSRRAAETRILFRNSLGNGRQNDHDEVLNAKHAFTRLGRYQPPHGLHGIIDREPDQAIRGLQAEEDLRVDRWIEPGGPTQRRLEERLGARWLTVADRRPRLRPDLPDWTPRLTDPETGDDLLAPDGRPFALSPARTRELLGEAERPGGRHPRDMSASELSGLRRWREGLSQLWGSGMPQPRIVSRPPIPLFKPDPPIPVLKPRPDDDEDEEGWLSTFGRAERSP